MKRLIAALGIAVMLVVPVIANAACSQAISTSAKGNWLSGAFDADDTYKIAFYTDSATYDATTAEYAATNEVTGTGYSAGGFSLDTPIAYGTSTTVYWMDWPDEVNATITFDAASTCAVIYNDTVADTDCSANQTPYACCTGASAGTCDDPVLGVWTFTSVQPSAGTLTVTFPTADASNAILRIAMDGTILESQEDLYAILERMVVGSE